MSSLAGAMGAATFAPAKLAQHRRHKLKADGERTSTRRLTFHTDFSSMHDASLLGQRRLLVSGRLALGLANGAAVLGHGLGAKALSWPY